LRDAYCRGAAEYAPKPSDAQPVGWQDMRDALESTLKCFQAAWAEGLSDRLYEKNDVNEPGSLADLVERRLLPAQDYIERGLTYTAPVQSQGGEPQAVAIGLGDLLPPQNPVTEDELELAFRYFCDYAPDHSEWTRLRCAINAFLSFRQKPGVEPIAWQWRFKKNGCWSDWLMEFNKEAAQKTLTIPDCEVRPLYASPPASPDGAVREADSKLEELVSRWESLKDGGGPCAPVGVLQAEMLEILKLARKGLTTPPTPGLIEAAEGVSTEELGKMLDDFEHGLVGFNETLFSLAREALANRKASAWQGIESAPHGVLVLVGWNDTMGVWNAETAYASQGWRRGGVSTMSRHGQATHWMPLPPAPPRSLPSNGDGK
jgi:hypothetical protein